MIDVRHLYKDQVWNDAETVYWFNLSGLHKEWFFGSDTYGIVESGTDSRVVDDEYNDIENDALVRIIKQLCAVTDKMRKG